MNENSMIIINEKSIFHKIKMFFRKIFRKNKINNNVNAINEEETQTFSNKKEEFKEYIKDIRTEETELLELQKQYRSGKIKEEDLSETQIKSLCDLYDRQIEVLQKSNEARKFKLLTSLKNAAN